MQPLAALIAALVPGDWKRRWIGWRNRTIANSRFQSAAASLPLLRGVSRRHASELFDLVAGFTYSQILLAAVESGLLDLLSEGPRSSEDVAKACGLSDQGALRLLRAGRALDLFEEVGEGSWLLGLRGAVLQADAGIQAMIRHHRLLYRDLSDPLGLLRQDRAEPTALSEFWTYAAADSQESDGNFAAYSDLMAQSQAMVARQVVAAYDFSRVKALLDVGGGLGIFAGAVATAHPKLKLGVFDLPEVIANNQRKQSSSERSATLRLHPGNFFADDLPEGYDCISLIRVLHDHDDDRAAALLLKAKRALPRNGRLIIAEPMADATGARRMGDAYFGLYLWAMRSGRPRRSNEIGALIERAGFSSWRAVDTAIPLVASIVVATN